MSFVAPQGLRRMASAKTRADIDRRNIMLQLMDRSQDPIMRITQEQYMQRRTYSATAVSNVKRSADATKADQQPRTWATPGTIAATEIKVSLLDGEELAYSMPRLDVLQSPLNEVENTRRKISSAIDNEIENNIVKYFNGLKASTTATDNEGAGGVTRKQLGTATSVFIAPPSDPYSKPATTGTGAADLVMDAVNDFIMWAKVQNLIDGRAIYGDFPATLYMVMHPLLFKFYLVDQLVDAGYSLDPLTSGALQNTQIFSGEAFTASLGLNRITILTPNSLPNAASGANNKWKFWGGYSEAVVGGIGPMLTQVISPEQNQNGDGWVLRQVVNPYYQLLSGEGIRQYTIEQD